MMISNNSQSIFYFNKKAFPLLLKTHLLLLRWHQVSGLNYNKGDLQKHTYLYCKQIFRQDM